MPQKDNAAAHFVNLQSRNKNRAPPGGNTPGGARFFITLYHKYHNIREKPRRGVPYTAFRCLSERSRMGALCVSAPEEIKSTPSET